MHKIVSAFASIKLLLLGLITKQNNLLTYSVPLNTKQAVQFAVCTSKCTDKEKSYFAQPYDNHVKGKRMAFKQANNKMAIKSPPPPRLLNLHLEELCFQKICDKNILVYRSC